ncbi:MAG: hypothetical protein AAGL49_04680 [Pseudomonadota bacterium]
MSSSRPGVYETPCTIEVEHTHDYLHAHVALDGDIEIEAGDRVRVHGSPISLRFGEKISIRRQATVHKAGWLRRLLTKISAHFELTELYEVSFSTARSL